MTITNFCMSCRNSLSGPLLELGELPPCNRFVEVPKAIDKHTLTVTACPSCGLVQLIDLAPVSMVVPRLPWIRYNEPESHLDDVAKALVGSFRQRPRNVLGVGPFDAPLLTRLESLGCRRNQLDLTAGVRPQIDGPAYPYLETIQACLRPTAVSQLKAQRADIVVCRYLIEHSHDPIASLAALQLLMTPDGVLLIEVPDSGKFLSALDYCFLWEEHVSYFVEPTIKRLVMQAGFEVEAFLRYEGQLEDALVMILRRSDARALEAAMPVADMTIFERYRSEFPARYDAYRARLRALAEKGKVALVGMGHQSIMFINAFDLQPFISLLVDDDPNKQGYCAPGTQVPIIPSSILAERSDIAACLLAVSPRVEPIVRQKLRGLSGRGAEIYPIYAGAPGKKLLGNVHEFGTQIS